MAENILKERGLLETISLADRCLEAERKLAEMQDIALIRDWSHMVITKARDFELCLYQMLANDIVLRRGIPDQERRKYVMQQMAAEMLGNLIMDATKGATLRVVEDHANNGMTAIFETHTYKYRVPDTHSWRGAW